MISRKRPFEATDNDVSTGYFKLVGGSGVGDFFNKLGDQFREHPGEMVMQTLGTVAGIQGARNTHNQLQQLNSRNAAITADKKLTQKAEWVMKEPVARSEAANDPAVRQRMQQLASTRDLKSVGSMSASELRKGITETMKGRSGAKSIESTGPLGMAYVARAKALGIDPSSLYHASSAPKLKGEGLRKLYKLKGGSKRFKGLPETVHKIILNNQEFGEASKEAQSRGDAAYKDFLNKYKTVPRGTKQPPSGGWNPMSADALQKGKEAKEAQIHYETTGDISKFEEYNKKHNPEEHKYNEQARANVEKIWYTKDPVSRGIIQHTQFKNGSVQTGRFSRAQFISEVQQSEAYKKAAAVNAAEAHKALLSASDLDPQQVFNAINMLTNAAITTGSVLTGNVLGATVGAAGLMNQGESLLGNARQEAANGNWNQANNLRHESIKQHDRQLAMARAWEVADESNNTLRAGQDLHGHSWYEGQYAVDPNNPYTGIKFVSHDQAQAWRPGYVSAVAYNSDYGIPPDTKAGGSLKHQKMRSRTIQDDANESVRKKAGLVSWIKRPHEPLSGIHPPKRLQPLTDKERQDMMRSKLATGGKMSRKRMRGGDWKDDTKLALGILGAAGAAYGGYQAYKYGSHKWNNWMDDRKSQQTKDTLLKKYEEQVKTHTPRWDLERIVSAPDNKTAAARERMLADIAIGLGHNKLDVRPISETTRNQFMNATNNGPNLDRLAPPTLTQPGYDWSRGPTGRWTPTNDTRAIFGSGIPRNRKQVEKLFKRQRR